MKCPRRIFRRDYLVMEGPGKTEDNGMVGQPAENRSLSFVGLPSINSGGPSPSCFVFSPTNLLWPAPVRDTAPHVAPRPPTCPRVTLHRPSAAAELSAVQVRYLTSATSSGRTQWTRLNTRGDPKRLSRGGGTASG